MCFALPQRFHGAGRRCSTPRFALFTTNQLRASSQRVFSRVQTSARCSCDPAGRTSIFFFFFARFISFCLAFLFAFRALERWAALRFVCRVDGRFSELSIHVGSAFEKIQKLIYSSVAAAAAHRISRNFVAFSTPFKSSACHETAPIRFTCRTSVPIKRLTT